MWLAVSGAQLLYTLGLSMFDLSLVDFLFLLWAPSTNIFFVKIIIWRTHTQSSKKSCKFKTWMKLVWQILTKLGASFSEVFFTWCPLETNLYKHSGGHPKITEAGISLHLTSLAGVCVVWRSKAHRNYVPNGITFGPYGLIQSVPEGHMLFQTYYILSYWTMLVNSSLVVHLLS